MTQIFKAAVLFLTALILTPMTSQADPLCNALIETRIETGSPAMALMVANSDGLAALCIDGKRIAGGDADVTKDDLWHLGSNTKAMTATAIGHYVQSGDLSWDTTMGDVVGKKEAKKYADTTYKQFLSHRSGIAPNPGMLAMIMNLGADESRIAPVDRAKILKKMLKKRASGAKFNYSNAGYMAAAYMLETQLDRPFEILMRESLWADLGMDSAGFGPPGIAGEEDEPRGHTGDSLSPMEPPADNPPAMNPAGRAHMTLSDYSKFLVDQLRGARGDSRAVYSAEIYQAIQTPIEDYALGWGVTETGALSHSGSNTMWLVAARIDPKADLIVVVAANDGRIDHLSPHFKTLRETVEAQMGEAGESAPDTP